MPVIRYTLLVGASLLALIFFAGKLLGPTSVSSGSNSAALDVLKEMAHHGERSDVAAASAAGPFLPMPAVVATIVAPAPHIDVPAPPVVAASATKQTAGQTSPLLDAQAGMTEADAKPAKRVKVAAKRKPRPRTVVVENVWREPRGFFGLSQVW